MTCASSRTVWVAALLALAACGRPHPLERVAAGEATVTGRGTLLIAVDALRWDRTSLGRSDRDTTPNLRRLVERGVSFDDTWAPQSIRFDAHVALLTGCDPIVARRPPVRADTSSSVLHFPRAVPLGTPSLAVQFLAGGCSTAAFVDDPTLSKARGFDRGFRDYVEYAGRGTSQFEDYSGTLAVGGRFLRWLNARALDEDWFAFLHVADLTRSWDGAAGAVPDGWELDAARSLRLPAAEPSLEFHALPRGAAPEGAADVAELELRYDVALQEFDRALGRIIGHVDEFGRDERVTIAVVGTFGVPFGESGVYLRSSLPDGPDLRVPWVLRPAGASSVARGVRSGALASLTDVAPTLLDLAGLPLDGGFHGLGRAEEVRRADAASGRATVFVRGHFGQGVVTDERHWARLSVPRSNAPLLESWFGTATPDVGGSITFAIDRAGPTAVDALRVDRPSARTRATDPLEALWDEWAEGVALARDVLQFGDDDLAASEDVAARLRALQATAQVQTAGG